MAENKEYLHTTEHTDRSPRSGMWTSAEHERFLVAMALYPRGPWRIIANYVGTRSTKQVHTHGQKYQQKLLRRRRGLYKQKTKVKRPEHRVDASTVPQFTSGYIMRQRRQVDTPKWPNEREMVHQTDVCAEPSMVDTGGFDYPLQQLFQTQPIPHTLMGISIEPVPFEPRPSMDHQEWSVHDLEQLMETLEVVPL